MSRRGRGGGTAAARTAEEEPIMPVFEELSDVMRNMGQNLTSLTNLMQAQNVRSNGNNGASGTGGAGKSTIKPDNSLYKRYKELQPPEYDGTEGVLAAAEWIRRLEKVFGVLGCTTEERVKLASFSLKKEAGCWWEDKRRTLPDTIDMWTWEQFKGAFEEMYLPSHARNALRTDFLKLEQGNMTVGQYSARFMELSRYAPEVVSTEDLKIEQFINGLRPYLYSRLHLIKYVKFEDALAAVQRLEEADKRYQSSKGQLPQQKRKTENRPGQKFSKKQFSSNKSGGQGSGPNRPICTRCGRQHSGECRIGSSACYTCGKEGHLMKDCPSKPRLEFRQQQPQQQQQLQEQIQAPYPVRPIQQRPAQQNNPRKNQNQFNRQPARGQENQPNRQG